MTTTAPLARKALGVVGVSGNRFLATGMQFLALLAVGNFFGAAEVGAIGASQAAILLLGTLCAGGAPLFTLRRVPRAAFDLWFRFSQFWVLICSGVAIFGALLFAVWTNGVFGNNLFETSWAPSTIPGGSANLVVLMAGCVGYGLSKVYLEVLKGRGLPGPALFLEFGFPFLVVLMAIPVCLAHPEISMIVLFSAVPSAFVFLALGLFWWIGRLPYQKAPRKSRFKRFARKSWRELLSLLSVQLCNSAMFSLPVLLASGFLGLKEAGILTILLKVVGISATVSGIVSAYFARAAVNTLRENVLAKKRRLARDMALSNAAATLAVLGPVLFAPEPILNLFYQGGSDTIAVSALIILLVLRLLRSLLGMPETLLALSGRSGYDLIAFGTALFIFIITLMILGITLPGLVWATGLSTLARGLCASTLAIFLVLWVEENKVEHSKAGPR